MPKKNDRTARRDWFCLSILQREHENGLDLHILVLSTGVQTWSAKILLQCSEAESVSLFGAIKNSQDWGFEKAPTYKQNQRCRSDFIKLKTEDINLQQMGKRRKGENKSSVWKCVWFQHNQLHPDPASESGLMSHSWSGKQNCSRLRACHLCFTRLREFASGFQGKLLPLVACSSL